jgi:hypothetical protein
MLHVLPYSQLSSKDNSDWLERTQPDVIIADECDALKDMTSSRTMRVMRYFEEHQTTRFCGWTGSLTDNSIKEFAHLSALALRYGSPLPIKRKVIDEWSACLDAVPNPCPPGALIRLLEPGQPASDLRKALHRRLAETPGFVMIEGRQQIISASGKEVSISVTERPAPPIPPQVAEALAKVRDWQRPDSMAPKVHADDEPEDEILIDPLEQVTCARQIATGMFYRWIFPRREPKQLIKQWYAARKAWNKELRAKKLRGEVNLDSDGLCIDAARRYWGDIPNEPDAEGRLLPVWKSDAWPAWRDIMDEVEPQTQAVRLDSFLVDDALHWAMQSPGIIWYQMVEFAEWVRERARELYGVDMPLYGEGTGKLIGNEIGNRSILASIESHGRGRDRLQYAFNRQLIANVPASARRWQQLLGRLHRRNQVHDAVSCEVYLHTDEVMDSFEQALRRGEFVEDVTHEEQKLLIGWEGR